MADPHHPQPGLILADLALATELLERLVMPLLMVVCAFLFGTVGFLLIGQGRWNLLDCAYMTSITLTTVGYGEVLEMMGPGARVFAMVLMWSGMGVTLYAVSTVTGFVVEKNLMRLLKERQMERRIASLKGHIIVCGAGRTGFNVVKELFSIKRPCVVIEGNPERAEWIQKHLSDIYLLKGDATEEEVLARAGIHRAMGIIATLNDDSHNLLITVQARYVNPSISIVARCDENNLVDKFYRAGANYVVNPAFIGGMRMASQMIRPNVVAFLDRMLRGQGPSYRVEEVVVTDTSPWVGHSLREVDMYRHTGLNPIALKYPDSDEFIYNPSSDEILKAQSIIVVICSPSQISSLKELCAGES